MVEQNGYRSESDALLFYGSRPKPGSDLVTSYRPSSTAT